MAGWNVEVLMDSLLHLEGLEANTRRKLSQLYAKVFSRSFYELSRRAHSETSHAVLVEGS